MESSVSSVTKQVSEALMNDPRTRHAIIEVGNNAGIVVLTGSVKSSAVFQAAEEIARQQPGVISVVNELKVG